MNEMKSPSGGAAGGASNLDARISQVQRDLAAQQVRLQRGSRLTAVVGGILCLLIVAYFYYLGYLQVGKILLEPQTLVDAAENRIINMLPAARQRLEEQIIDSSDEWAVNLSQTFQDNIPEVREQLEDAIMDHAGKSIDELRVMTAEQFRNFIGQNRQILADGFTSFKNPDEAKVFMTNLNEAVEKSVSNDMREQSEDMMHYLIDLNSKLDLLKKGDRMSPEQAIEREILMVAKRLQVMSALDEPRKTSRGQVAAEGAPEMEAESETSEKGADQPAEDAPKNEGAEASSKDDSKEKETNANPEEK